jgi:thiol:disulfide interchange protein DsbD
MAPASLPGGGSLWLRRRRVTGAWPAWLLLGGLGAACTADSVDFGETQARATLLARPGSVRPGETDTLGISLDIKPEWHLYWNGQNDTGYPISAVVTLPEGWEAGDLLWPTPERHVSAGGILDHVYRGRVTLLLPVRIPETVPPGEYPVRGEVQWLACREACIPGGETVELGLRVSDREEGTDAAGPPDAALRFEEALARLPEAVPVVEGAPRFPASPALLWRREGETVRIEVPDARRLSFYPHADSAPLASLIEDGTADGGRLVVRLKENVDPHAFLAGVLEIELPARTVRYAIRLPLTDPS